MDINIIQDSLNLCLDIMLNQMEMFLDISGEISGCVDTEKFLEIIDKVYKFASKINTNLVSMSHLVKRLPEFLNQESDNG